MKPITAILTALGAMLLAGGCGERARPEGDPGTFITVTGPRAAVERFVAQSQARAPTKEAPAVVGLADGEAQARLRLPDDTDGTDLGEIARTALDAGLSYRVEIGRPS